MSNIEILEAWGFKKDSEYEQWIHPEIPGEFGFHDNNLWWSINMEYTILEKPFNEVDLDDLIQLFKNNKT